MPKASQTFIAAVAPVCLRSRGRSRDIQRDLHALGLAFRQTPADVELLEVLGRFIGRALLGYGKRVVFDPIDWIGGDRQVALVAAGEGQAPEDRDGLASALGQARTIGLSETRWSVAARTLKSSHANPAAFVMAGILLGAMHGPRAFGRPPPDHAELSTLAEQLLQSSRADMDSPSGPSRSR